MQDQNQNQNRKSGLQQESQNADTNWQSAGNVSSDDNNRNENEVGPEVDYPQQPRRQEEPIVGGQGNMGRQEGGMGSQQGDMSDGRSRNQQDAKRPMGNSGTRKNEGSRTEQGDMSDGNAGTRKTESDDYRRNDIGNTEQQG